MSHNETEEGGDRTLRDDLSYKRMLTEREGQVGIPGRGKNTSKKASKYWKKVERTLSWGRDGKKGYSY